MSFITVTEMYLAVLLTKFLVEMLSICGAFDLVLHNTICLATRQFEVHRTQFIASPPAQRSPYNVDWRPSPSKASLRRWQRFSPRTSGNNRSNRGKAAAAPVVAATSTASTALAQATYAKTICALCVAKKRCMTSPAKTMLVGCSLVRLGGADRVVKTRCAFVFSVSNLTVPSC